METEIAVKESKPLILPELAEALRVALNARKSDLEALEWARSVLSRYYYEYTDLVPTAGDISGKNIIGDTTGI